LTKTEFKVLFDLHFDAIRRYLYYRCSDSELASDIAQDLFTRIWEKDMSIDPARDKALLYKMASDMFVSKNRRKQIELNFANSIEIKNVTDSPDKIIEMEQLRSNYSKILSEMPEKIRVTFLMSRGEDLKYQEIAELLKIDVKTVEKRMSGALALLRRKLLGKATNK
jgi:RNA polymerase sigma-70 factor (ECF subfamily)